MLLALFQDLWPEATRIYDTTEEAVRVCSALFPPVPIPKRCPLCVTRIATIIGAPFGGCV